MGLLNDYRWAGSAEPTPRAAPSPQAPGVPYGDVISAAADRYGVPADVLMRIASVESGFNPRAIGQPTQWGRARGLFQFLDSTARGLGIDPMDPAQAADGAARMFADNLARFGSVEGAVAAHFAGPDTSMWGPKTAQYVRDVLGRDLSAPARKERANPFADDLAAVDEIMRGLSVPPRPAEAPAADDTQSTGAGGDAWRLFKAGSAQTLGAIPRLADLLTGGAIGKDTADGLARYAEERLAETTPDTRAALAKKWLSDEPDKLFGDAWSDWRSYAAGVVQNLPSFLPGLGTTAWAVRSARAAAATDAALAAGRAMASGATRELADAAAASAFKATFQREATRLAARAGMATEGVIGSGQNAEQARGEIMGLSADDLMALPEAQALAADGKDENAIREELARRAMKPAAVLGGLADAAFGGVGDRVLARLMTGDGGTFLRRVATGFAGEAGEEAAQSAGEQIGVNVGLQQTGMDRGTFAGVGEQAVGGAIIGGLMGGGVGGLMGSREAPLVPEMTAGQPPAPAGMTEDDIAAARAGLQAEQAQAAQRQAMREGASAAQANPLVPFVPPLSRFSERAGPGQTANMGNLGGLLSSPFGRTLEGEFTVDAGPLLPPGDALSQVMAHSAQRVDALESALRQPPAMAVPMPSAPAPVSPAQGQTQAIPPEAVDYAVQALAGNPAITPKQLSQELGVPGLVALRVLTAARKMVPPVSTNPAAPEVAPPTQPAPVNPAPAVAGAPPAPEVAPASAAAAPISGGGESSPGKHPESTRKAPASKGNIPAAKGNIPAAATVPTSAPAQQPAAQTAPGEAGAPPVLTNPAAKMSPDAVQGGKSTPNTQQEARDEQVQGRQAQAEVTKGGAPAPDTTEAKTKAPSEAQPKETWAMTRDEFVQAVRGGRDFKQIGTNPTPLKTLRGAGAFDILDRQAKNHHQATVTMAFLENKGVPPEALADYPELAGIAKRRSAEEQQQADAKQAAPTPAPAAPQLAPAAPAAPAAAAPPSETIKAGEARGLRIYPIDEMIAAYKGDKMFASMAADLEKKKAEGATLVVMRGPTAYPARDQAHAELIIKGILAVRDEKNAAAKKADARLVGYVVGSYARQEGAPADIIASIINIAKNGNLRGLKRGGRMPDGEMAGGDDLKILHAAGITTAKQLEDAIVAERARMAAAEARRQAVPPGETAATPATAPTTETGSTGQRRAGLAVGGVEDIDASVDEIRARTSPPATPAPTAPPQRVSSNTIITDAMAEAARARLKSKLGRLNTGIDPEMLADGAVLAAYHIERGFRSFAAYSAQMVKDMGETVRPYLRAFYEGARHFPGFDAEGMTSYADLERLKEGRGERQTVVTPQGREIDTQFEVVPLADLIDSSNANFPAELQPRDRAGRIGSDAQIAGIAAKLDPELLNDSRLASQGAPVVGADGVVESGNGRIAAIRSVYQKGGGRADAYRAMIAARGFDIARIESPVLIRRRLTDLSPRERIEFTHEANDRSELDMSPSERAKADARFLTGDLLSRYRGGDMDSGANADFVRGFMAELTAAAQGNLLTADGALSQAGARRIESAILARAYADTDLLQKLTESTDSNIKTIGGALLDAAPSFAKLKAAIEAGAVPEELDITGHVVGAARLVSDARRQGIALSERVAQNDIMAGATPAMTEDVLRLMFRDEGFKRPAGRDAIADLLRGYADSAMSVQAGDSLFTELPQVRAVDILSALQEKADAETRQAESQQALFGANPSGTSRAGRRGEAQRAGDGRQGGSDVARGARQAGVEAVEPENPDAAGSRADLERDRRDAGPGDAVGAQGVQDGAAGDGGLAGRGVPEPAGEGRPAADRSGDVDGQTLDVGGAGHRWLSDGSEPAGPAAGAADRGDAGGGRATGDTGVQPDADTNQAAVAVATAGATQPADLAAKRAAQAAAQDVAVVPKDPDNIRAALPFLTDGQRDDVLFAEQRFDQPDGYGVLFTNGTGTGKTYTSLGIVKRFERAGRTNILIVVPSQTLIDDYVAAGKNLLLDVKPLDGTRDSGGSGPVITTYAAFGQNDALAGRAWDLIVTDESQNLSQAADGSTTNALEVLRALALHPDGSGKRARMLHPGLYEAAVEANRALRKNINPDMQAGLQAQADEAHAAWGAALKRVEADVKAKQGAARPRVVMLSATPFAYRENIQYADGFLLDFNPVDTSAGYNAPKSGFNQFMVSHFGYRMRYGKLTKPEAGVNVGLMETELNARLRRSGALSWRGLAVDADYDRRFLIAHDAIVTKIDEGQDFLRASDKFAKLRAKLTDRFNYLAQSQLLEAIKAKAAIPYIRASLDAGRKVVVFHNYNVGGAVHPFRLPELETIDGAKDESELAKQYRVFKEERPDLYNLDLTGLVSPIDALTRAFPEALLFNGTVSSKTRTQNKALFNADDGQHRIIIVQSDAGGAGLSLHDTTGKFQRVLLNLGLPVRPVTAIQQEGRIYRMGVMTDAIIRYMATGTIFERIAFAQKIAERTSTVENLSMGDAARDLKRAFIDAFEDARKETPSADDGKGGKAADRAIDRALTPFDKAKTHYFAQMKKAGRRDQREGFDYFPTPEPVGLKMVEWLGLKANDSALEPSAGHGAIARYFPENVRATAVEPSADLASRLAMAMTGRVITGRFEDLHVTNKYDGIAMNPPFGKGGKLAVEHLAKAATHLNSGGRIVALLPSGPSADKRFDQWYESDEAKGFHLVADITMPAVLFERAGTGVSTRIVVIDRSNDPAQQRMRDLSSAETIGELFDRLQDMEMPPRSPAASKADARVKFADPDLEAARQVARGDSRASMDAAARDLANGDVEGAAMMIARAQRQTASSDFHEASAGAADAVRAMPALDRLGIKVTPTVTANGKAAWEVSGKTFEHKDAIKRAGGKWYGPKKVWTFYDGDPTEELSQALDAGPASDAALYSRVTSTPASATPAGRGLPLQQAQRIAAAFARRLGLAPERIAVHGSAREIGAPDGYITKGAYDPQTGTVYLFADALDGAEDARRVLLHEVVGHLGVRAAVGDGWATVRRLLEQGRAGDRGIADLFEQVAREESAALDADAVADEVIGRAAELYGAAGPLHWRRILGAIRAALRRLGLVSDGYSLNEVVDLLAAGRRAVRAAGAAPGGAPAFSREQAAEGSEAWARLMYEAGTIPDGWYVHGRKGRQDLSTGTVIQVTQDWEIADQYAGRNGSKWMLRPSGDATVMDFSSEDTADVDRVVKRAWKQYSKGLLPGEMATGLEGGEYDRGDLPRDVFEQRLRKALTPENIVDSADFFDAPEMAEWLHDQFGVDFVRTPDGGVAINLDGMQAVKVPGAAEPSGEALRFSRARDLGSNVADYVRDTISSPRTFNLLNRTVGTQLHKAWKSPEYARVYRSVQDFLQDAQTMAYRASDKAKSLLPKLDGVRDVFQHIYPRDAKGRRVRRADVSKAAAAVFDGRIADRRWNDDELRARGLNDTQVGLYHEARAAIDASLDDVAASVMARLAMLDGVPGALITQAQADPGRAFAILSPHVKDATLSRMREENGRIAKLKRNGYAPLSRFGDYFVRVTKPGPRGGDEVLFRAHFESKREMFAAARALEADPEYRGAQVATGVLPKEDSTMFTGLTPETLELFGDALELDMGKHSAAYQEYLKTAVAARSALKRLIHARKIEGYSQDLERVLASFIISNSRHASRAYHSAAMSKAWADIPERMGDVRDEAAKLIDYVQNPREEAAGVRSLLFAQFLGGSVASALTNMTQPVMMTYPYLSSIKGVGPAKAAALMGRAVKAITTGGDSDLMAAMKRAEADGTVAPQEIHQLYAEAIRSGLSSNRYVGRWLRAAAAVWGSLFSLSEQVNRRITFAAAYLAARETGRADPFAFAEQAVNETQGVYCVDTETEILTAAGWKKYSDLSVGEMVFSVDAEGALKESALQAVHVFPGKHNVTEFTNSNGLSIVVTDGHNNFIQSYNSRDKKWQDLRFVKLNDIKDSHFFLRAPLSDGTDRKAIYTDDQVRLLAWVAAEGHFFSHRNVKEKRGVGIVQSLSHNPQYVDEIDGLLDRLGGEYNRKVSNGKCRSDTMICWQLRKPLWAFVHEALPEKRVTMDLVSRLTIPQVGIFLDTFAKGDGHYLKDGGTAIGQKSVETLHVLQAMAVLAGNASTIWERIENVANGGFYEYGTVYVAKTSKRAHVKAFKRVKRAVNTVWCPETATGTWIARRNGRTFITGNSKGNRPNVARGAPGAVLMAFKQYSIAYMEFLARLPTRERAMALGILMLAAGLQGLPGADDLDDGIDTLAQALGYNFRTEDAKRRFLQRVFGNGLSDFLMYGLSTTGVPLDFQQRLGLGNLIPGTALLKRSSTDKSRDVMELAGPAGSVVQQWMRAWDAFTSTGLAEGALLRGGWEALQQMAPVAVGNVAKFYDMRTTGYALDAKGKRIAPVTTGDAVTKLIGFQPASLAAGQRNREGAQESIALARDEESRITEIWADGVFQKDRELVARARARLSEWNTKNPEAPIRVTLQQIRRRVQEMGRTRDERLIRSAPRELRQGARGTLSG